MVLDAFLTLLDQDIQALGSVATQGMHVRDAATADVIVKEMPGYFLTWIWSFLLKIRIAPAHLVPAAHGK